MNAPFYPGQKIVRIGESNEVVKKGNIYECVRCTQCKCGYWFVQIKIPAVPSKYTYLTCTCKDCGKKIKTPLDYLGGDARRFAPIQTNYADATAEIIEKFKSPEESPDKIIIPEKLKSIS